MVKRKVGDICKRCRRGRIQPYGYAFDGRPQYTCSNCAQTHTYGHDGHEWDSRTRLPEELCYKTDEERRLPQERAKVADLEPAPPLYSPRWIYDLDPDMTILVLLGIEGEPYAGDFREWAEHNNAWALKKHSPTSFLLRNHHRKPGAEPAYIFTEDEEWVAEDPCAFFAPGISKAKNHEEALHMAEETVRTGKRAVHRPLPIMVGMRWPLLPECYDVWEPEGETR